MLRCRRLIPVGNSIALLSQLECSGTISAHCSLRLPSLSHSTTSASRDIGDVLQKSLQYLGWKHIGMFGGYSGASSWDGVDELWRVVENELKSHFIITASMRYTNNNLALLQERLRSISSIARVVILICSSEDAKIILLAADSLGLNTGEFVFVILQQLELLRKRLRRRRVLETSLPNAEEATHSTISWEEQAALELLGSSNPSALAFQSARIIGVSHCAWHRTDINGYPDHDNFLSQEDARTSTQDGVVRDVELGQVSPYSAYLHDTVLLYAETMTQVIKAGGDFQDGRQLVNALKGSSQTMVQGILQVGIKGGCEEH
ncbi:Guanylate cyclase 2G [Plecturocebus cupreus]